MCIVCLQGWLYTDDKKEKRVWEIYEKKKRRDGEKRESYKGEKKKNKKEARWKIKKQKNTTRIDRKR